MAQAFEAGTLPHTSIIDNRGETILYSKEGQFSADEWTNALSYYRSGVRPVAYQPVVRSQPSFSSAGCST